MPGDGRSTLAIGINGLLLHERLHNGVEDHQDNILGRNYGADARALELPNSISV